MKNYADLGGCYPPQPSASADNTLLDLHNSSYHTQPHPIIANYQLYLTRVTQNSKYTDKPVALEILPGKMNWLSDIMMLKVWQNHANNSGVKISKEDMTFQ